MLDGVTTPEATAPPPQTEVAQTPNVEAPAIPQPAQDGSQAQETQQRTSFFKNLLQKLLRR